MFINLIVAVKFSVSLRNYQLSFCFRPMRKFSSSRRNYQLFFSTSDQCENFQHHGKIINFFLLLQTNAKILSITEKLSTFFLLQTDAKIFIITAKLSLFSTSDRCKKFLHRCLNYQFFSVSNCCKKIQHHGENIKFLAFFSFSTNFSIFSNLNLNS